MSIEQQGQETCQAALHAKTPGQLATQTTVANGVATLQFQAQDGSTRQSAWRVAELATHLGIDVNSVCWGTVIIMAQARDGTDASAHAMARCLGIGQVGHEHAQAAAHVVPQGLTRDVLARFRNP